MIYIIYIIQEHNQLVIKYLENNFTCFILRPESVGRGPGKGRPFGNNLKQSNMLNTDEIDLMSRMFKMVSVINDPENEEYRQMMRILSEEAYWELLALRHKYDENPELIEKEEEENHYSEPLINLIFSRVEDAHHPEETLERMAAPAVIRAERYLEQNGNCISSSYLESRPSFSAICKH